MTKLKEPATDDQWIADLERQGTVVLEHDRGVLVVDACRPWNAVVASTGDADVVERLNEQHLRLSREPFPRAEIWYVGPWPADAAASTAIKELAAHLGARASALRVYFADEADLIGGLNEFAGPTGRCSAQFFGCLPELSEDSVSAFLMRGASASEVAGWPPDKASPDLQRLSRLSELGLRLPVTVYVHRDNIGEVVRLAEECLHANYNAGIALEPACAHPLFGESDVAMLPEPDEYCELLVEAYDRFRHYDDVLEPLTSLVANLRDGGFDPSSSESLPMRYRVDAFGGVRRFRQLPWAVLRGENSSNASTSSLATACPSCRWKNACGGCDASDNAVFDLICRFRMLFLEYFVREMHHQLLHGSGSRNG